MWISPGAAEQRRQDPKRGVDLPPCGVVPHLVLDNYLTLHRPLLASYFTTPISSASASMMESVSNMDETPRLPLELIFQVIDSLVGDSHVILRPSHSITKTLLSLALVCRATYPVASNYLRQHCVYIDNDRRLRDLIYCVESTKGADATDTQPTASLRLGAPLRPISTLYLAPFAATLDDQPTAIWIRELFCVLHPSLRSLVVDVPLRSLCPADDHLNVRKTLRDAFGLLTSLEELVSVRDELYLDVLEPDWRRADEPREAPVWTLWPGLRRLALYNVDADERFWANARGMRELETVVLTRADGLWDTCLKSAYLGVSASGGAVTAADGPEPGAPPPRPLKVVLVNVSSQHPDRFAGQRKWAQVDPGNVVSAATYDVPVSFYGDDDDIQLCQNWVKTAALRKELWEWEGTPVRAGRDGEETSTAAVFELEA